MKLALLASGSGSNVQAIIDAVARKSLHAELCFVASNKPDAPVLARAAQAGIPHLGLDHTSFASREAFDTALVAAIREHGADTVALAGYMRLLTPYFLSAFPNRVVNIHPAILPAFQGAHGIDDARAWGVKLTGCTVHFVDEEVDHGAVIIQAATWADPAEGQEPLEQRIHRLEHRIFPQALEWLATGRLRMDGRHVHVQASGKPLAAPMSGSLVYPPLEEGF